MSDNLKCNRPQPAVADLAADREREVEVTPAEVQRFREKLEAYAAGRPNRSASLAALVLIGGLTR